MARAGWIAAARALPESGGVALQCPSTRRRLPVTRLQREAPRPAQLPDLCALYLGDAGYAAYVTLISGYMLGSLWCYAAIFAAARGEPHRAERHVLYVGLFAVFVVPLSLKDLADQKAVQTLLAFGRVVMLAVMLVTALTYLWSMGRSRHYPSGRHLRRRRRSAPVVTFSLVLHHSVPQIVAPVKVGRVRQERAFEKGLRQRLHTRLVRRAGGLLFGEKTQSAANLGWATYHHVHSEEPDPERAEDAPHRLPGAIRVLYPAVNVLATYPLNVITFGDALLAAHRRFQANGEPRRRVEDLRPDPRLVAAVPPLIGACIQPDISSVTNVTGCFGLFLCASRSGVLSLAARRLAPGPTEHVAAERKGRRGGTGPRGPCLDGGSAAAAALNRTVQIETVCKS